MDVSTMAQTIDSFPRGLRWYVVNTKPRNEKQSQNYLQEHGIETFLPLMETSQCNLRKKPRVLKPLFPNYLFAYFDLQHSYPIVKWGKGVNHILGFGRYPTPIADDVLSLIKNRTDEEDIVKKAYNFEKNDRIKITSGPLKDLLAIFERWVSDSGRVRVLLNVIGYQPKVELHYSQLERVG